MLLLKNSFLEKIETWHVGLSCQYTHFMSFSSKSEHDIVADQATLIKSLLVLTCNAKLDPTLRMGVTSQHVSTIHASVSITSFLIVHVFSVFVKKRTHFKLFLQNLSSYVTFILEVR